MEPFEIEHLLITDTAALVLKIRKVLQIDDSTKDDAILNMAAADLGVDSLNAVEIRTWFMKEAKVDMPVLRILGGSTIAELVQIAIGSITTEMAPALAPDFVAKPKAERAKTAPPQAQKNTKPQPAKTKASPNSKQTAAPKTVSKQQTPSQTKQQTHDSSDQYKLNRPLVSVNLGAPNSNTPNNDAATHDHKASPASAATSKTTTDTTLSDSHLGGSSDQHDSSASLTDSDLEVVSNNGSNDYVAINTVDNEVIKTESMSHGQSRFWFLRSFLRDQTTFNITLALTVTGQLRVTDLEWAVKTVGQRHEALRTRFFEDDQGRLLQGVLSQPTLALEQRTYHDEKSVMKSIEEIKNNVYDIEKGCLMRIMLLSPSKNIVSGTKEHHLVIGYHHINMDGVSLEVVLTDLEKAYRRQSLPKALPYPEFTRRQNMDQSKGAWNDDVAFWKKELAGAPTEFPLLRLSRLTARQNLADYKHRHSDFRVPQALASKIRSICTKLKITAYHFYLVTFYTMLSRLSGEADFCIGVADANRHEKDTLDAVGIYLNLLPLRFNVGTSTSFNDAAKAARAKAYSAMAHSRVPINVLLDELKIPRAATHNPLFQVFLDYRQSIEERRTFGNVQMQGQEYHSSRTGYDVVVDIVDNKAGEALIELSVQHELYSSHAALLMKNIFRNLVEQFAADPGQALGAPSLYDMKDITKAIELGRGKIAAR